MEKKKVIASLSAAVLATSLFAAPAFAFTASDDNNVDPNGVQVFDGPGAGGDEAVFPNKINDKAIKSISFKSDSANGVVNGDDAAGLTIYRSVLEASQFSYVITDADDATYTGNIEWTDQAAPAVVNTPAEDDETVFKVVDYYVAKPGEELLPENIVTNYGNYSQFEFLGYDANLVGETQDVTVRGFDSDGNALSKTVQVHVLKDFSAFNKSVEAGAQLTASDLVSDPGEYSDFTVEGYNPNAVGDQLVTIRGVFKAANGKEY
ncbi:MAG: hypothetical protein Q3961_04595, partial [Bifidobacteriaceae bacterium]|nr:hypothetical protein [Bifidobacteriaceae bacterium]